MGSEIIYKAPKFFRANNISHKFYDLYLTANNLVLVYVGETYRSFLLRASNPGYKRRQELADIAPQEIITSSDQNIILSQAEVKKIKLTPPSFFKNLKLKLETKQREYTLYTENKKLDLEEIKQMLINNNYPLYEI